MASKAEEDLCVTTKKKKNSVSTSFGKADLSKMGTVLSWQSLLVLFVYLLMLLGACNGMITCVCTTQECRNQRVNRCNTTNMCYTQYLDRKDGKSPLTRGCINDNTPLLCENRKPAVLEVNWPVLVCCNYDLCNKNAVPTISTRLKEIQQGNDSQSPSGTAQETDDDEESIENRHRSKRVNAIYIAVPIAGICMLVVIVAIAIYLLRQRNQFFDNDFGISRNRYLDNHCPHEVSVVRLNTPDKKCISDGTAVKLLK